MAQQVEHVLGKDEVAGSNPANSSIFVAQKGCNGKNPQDMLNILWIFLYVVVFAANANGTGKGNFGAVFWRFCIKTGFELPPDGSN